jgi:hypothetical protein
MGPRMRRASCMSLGTAVSNRAQQCRTAQWDTAQHITVQSRSHVVRAWAVPNKLSTAQHRATLARVRITFKMTSYISTV